MHDCYTASLWAGTTLVIAWNIGTIVGNITATYEPDWMQRIREFCAHRSRDGQRGRHRADTSETVSDTDDGFEPVEMLRDY